jgi:hypothetical protein
MKIAVQVKRWYRDKYEKSSLDWKVEGQIKSLQNAMKGAHESNEYVEDKYKWDIHILNIITPFDDAYTNIKNYKRESGIYNFDLIIVSFIDLKDDWILYDKESEVPIKIKKPRIKPPSRKDIYLSNKESINATLVNSINNDPIDYDNIEYPAPIFPIIYS